ncbi:putative ribonuclease H-like domain-containing protein [Tanacetum coccineum]
MIEGNGPKWLFDIDSLTQSMNYAPIVVGIISNESAGTQGELNAGTSTQKEEISQDCIVMPNWKDASYFDSPSKDVGNGEPKSAIDDQKQVEDGSHNESDEKYKFKDDNSPKEVNTAGQHVNTTSPEVNTGRFKLNTVDPSVNTASLNDQNSPKDMFKLGASHTLEATHVEFFSDEDEPEVDLGDITNSYIVPTTPNTRIHKDHPIKNVIGDVKSSIQTRRMTKSTSEQGFLSAEEGIDYEEVFAPVARTKAIRLFLAYASFMGFLVYQMDVKSAFLYGTIEEEVYITQPLGFKDPDHPDKVYKIEDRSDIVYQEAKGDILLVQVYVDDIIFGSTNKELCNAFEKLMRDKFQMSSMGELTFFLGLQVTKKEDGIFISHDKYIAEILKKFNYTDVKSASTPVDLEKPLVKDGDADDADVHLYRSMIGSLMYLTASRPDIIYPKGKPTLGLWYSRDSPFELVAYTNSNYAGATQDMKSTTRDLLTKGFDAGRHVKRGRDTKIPQSSGPPVKVGDEAVHKELGDRMERAATTASSLEAEQDSGSGPRVHTLGSGEDSMQLMELMAHCTKLSALFWQTASTSTLKDGQVEITTTIDGQLKTITEASLRRHLKLEDADNFSSLPNTEIFEHLAFMEYASDSDKLTFQKVHFSPQWRFLIHIILHCLSPKKTAWEQFSSNIAIAIIFLATNRTFNFSKMIFEGMVKILDSTSKFLMYPRFIQILLNKHQRLLLPHKRTYVAPTLTQKLFSNMRMVSKGYTGVNIPLFSSMLVQGLIQQGEGSIVPVESHHTLITTPSTLQPPLSSPSRVPTSPYDSPLPRGHTPGSDEGNEGTSWIQEDAEIQGMTSADTEILLDQEEPTEQVGDLGSGEKGEKEISTANISVSTASATPEVSTTAKNLVYIRRSVEKRKDKGKAIMKEDESVRKKTKNQLEQERLGHEEAIRLQEQINEKEIQRIARDAEIANQLQEEFDRARQEQEVVAEGGYKQSHFNGMSYKHIRPIFKRVWDQNNAFVPKDSEIEKEVMKRPGFDFQQKSSKKRSREDSDEDNAKKQKLEDDAEKEELRDSMDVVPRDDIAIDVESLATKYPIVDWKAHVLTENIMYYEIIRVDGSLENYKIFSEMLNDFDRKDVMDLYRLVQERYDTTSPEGYNLLLWGDLKILFEPNEEE